MLTTSIREYEYIMVWVPLPVKNPYYYIVYKDLPNYSKLVKGSLLKVSFNNKEINAIAGDRITHDEMLKSYVGNHKEIKPVITIYDLPSISNNYWRFLEFFSDYNMVAIGHIWRLVLRGFNQLLPPKQIKYYYLFNRDFNPKNDNQSALVNLLSEHNYLIKDELLKQSGASISSFNNLIKKGIINYQLKNEDISLGYQANITRSLLNNEQNLAAQTLCNKVKDKKYSSSLLYGVTGSGKTEVYFAAIEQALVQKQQILVLVPEIALTEQLLARFTSYFGFEPAKWHSSLTGKQRNYIWQHIVSGDIPIVIGARSSLFIPYKNLGLIIVDEEHDVSYKQEENIYYHLRDMAVMRAFYEDIAIILASATPSVESKHNVMIGKYQEVRLKNRFSDYEMPEISLINISDQKLGGKKLISHKVAHALEQNIDRHEQSLLFLNRRGYAPFTICRTCGYQFRCHQCSSNLVYHQNNNYYLCHQCYHKEPYDIRCPECSSLDLNHSGVGVERLADEVKDFLPQARIMVLSSDLMNSFIKLQKALKIIEDGEVDIIIGTQLVTKGHNFPLLSLVVVLDIDTGLKSLDFRANERSFQILTQVAGRAGRYGHKSRALIQTSIKDHIVFKALLNNDSEEFYHKELAIRAINHYPPFGRLAAIIISSENIDEGAQYAQLLRRNAPEDSNISILGPKEAPIFLLAGRYRFRLLLKAKNNSSLQNYIRKLLRITRPPNRSIRINIDIDPQNFL